MTKASRDRLERRRHTQEAQKEFERVMTEAIENRADEIVRDNPEPWLLTAEDRDQWSVRFGRIVTRREAEAAFERARDELLGGGNAPTTETKQ